MLLHRKREDPNEHAVEADVYAGDTRALQSGSAAGGAVFVFRVEADAEADTFARVAGVFNIANTAPLRVSLRRAEPGRVNISVEIAVAGAVTADMICRKLEQLTCTISAEIVARDCGVF